MKFVKILTEKTIEYAPNPLIIGDKAHFTTDEAVFNSAGYKRLVENPYPTEGKIYDYRYVEVGNRIERQWYEVPAPPYVPTDVEKLRADVDYIALMTDVELEE